MSYRYRECSVCHGTMDPEEGNGGVCDECIQKKAEELAREEMLKRLFDSNTRAGFRQMRMEDFLNV